MSSDIALRVKNLSKCYQIYAKPQDRVKQLILRGKKQYYSEFWALKDVNFEVKKGESIGIIGRNGSGKSTLLQLLCKTLTPTRGTVEANGRIAALLELGAGFNPEFTGRENVYINGAILGFSRAQISQRFQEIAEFADIGEFMDRPVKSYSSGMFVRLAFAVQACVNPDILIIDEALAVGDVFFRQKCYDLLNRLLKKGVSIILVSHSLNEIEQFCQRALVLKQGVPVFMGPASEAVKRYYLLEQEARSLATPATPHELVNLDEADSTATSTLENWPHASAFGDTSHLTQVDNGIAKCTRVTVCDAEGKPCYAFQQGDTASFFFEFELFQDIEAPNTGLVIRSDKGIIVHGKGTIEYGTSIPRIVKAGEFLRIRQDICLEIGLGEYTFEVTLSTMPYASYCQRSHYPYAELYAALTRVCLAVGGFFSVLPRTHASPVQLLHHGVANLPGTCQVAKL